MNGDLAHAPPKTRFFARVPPKSEEFACTPPKTATAPSNLGMTRVHIGQSHVRSLIALNLRDFQSEFLRRSKI